MIYRSQPVILILIVSFLAACHGIAQENIWDIPDLDLDEFSEIMILGTPHLSQFGEEFNKSHLERVISLLSEFAPQKICIEVIPPATLHMMAHRSEYDVIVSQFAKDYVRFGKQIQKSMNISWQQAHSKVDVLLKNENHLTFEQRAELIPLLIAEYDYYSALLNWKILTLEERKRVPYLDDNIKDSMTKDLLDNNETVSIAIELAFRLGHSRIYPIDDHSDKDDYMKIVEQFGTELASNELAKSQPWLPFVEKINERQDTALRNADLLPLYLYMNSDDFAQADLDAQWKIFFSTKLESKLDLSRVALWEVRNLNMASNIRRVTAMQPGSKTLVIVGASHRSFLERYLSNMMGVRIISFSDKFSSSK